MHVYAILNPRPPSPSTVFLGFFVFLSRAQGRGLLSMTRNAENRHGTAHDSQGFLLRLLDVSNSFSLVPRKTVVEMLWILKVYQMCLTFLFSSSMLTTTCGPFITLLLGMNTIRIFYVLPRPSVRATPASSSDSASEHKSASKRCCIRGRQTSTDF
ncbi:hypothetical protein K438DRAFT_827952 [Mycena galopus ATCC 62051]|nr:hypothetical protein K438DRAFT_827952 [Mycena galopus ATCC 62051]